MFQILSKTDWLTVRAYFALLKPRVVSLVTFTAVTGAVLAYFSGYHAPFFSVFTAIFCIAVGSGAAGALNMYYDRDIDAIMSRTSKRPIPQGKISPEAALVFGLVLFALSVLLMELAVNHLSAVLLSVAVFYYSVIYTICLKRSTPQNIVVGGGAGAFPPMIGWAAVANHIGVESLVLFLIIFLWTPPHFWALALKNSGEYEAAGIPMLPVTSGVKATKMQILCYSVLLFITSILPYLLRFSGVTYMIVAFILGFVFLYYAINVYLDEKKCMKLFYYSVLYLFLLFGTLILDAALSTALGMVI
ncbi:heme o synthase [Neorickettsia risticii]|uniref:heme o synthase n=1 Tax=Neorickettsia risticii TaxID=950 RepID=UPI00059CEDBC|nr:heme o synthase [Neorickettsia risticii]